MRALIDTCIIIDYLQNREPFADDADKILYELQTNSFQGYITASSLTDIYYITHRFCHDAQKTREIVSKLCEACPILDTTAKDCIAALKSPVADYEDAVAAEVALSNRLDCIVTRNTKDYINSKVPAYSPSDFLQKLN